jgi:hypothetical protein
VYLKNKTNRDKAQEVHQRIEESLHHNSNDLNLESDARKFYEQISRDLGFTELDNQVICALSWEWKDRPMYRSHPYSCRSWIVIACLFLTIKVSVN